MTLTMYVPARFEEGRWRPRGVLADMQDARETAGPDGIAVALPSPEAHAIYDTGRLPEALVSRSVPGCQPPSAIPDLPAEEHAALAAEGFAKVHRMHRERAPSYDIAFELARAEAHQSAAAITALAAE
jgi:hypothetical protein